MTSPTDSTVDSDSESSARLISRRELRRKWQREQEGVDNQPKSIFDLEYVPPAPPAEAEAEAEPELEIDVSQISSEPEPELEVTIASPKPAIASPKPATATAPKLDPVRRVLIPPAPSLNSPAVPALLFERIPDEDGADDTRAAAVSVPEDEGASQTLTEQKKRRSPIAKGLGIAAAFGLLLTLALPAIDLVYVEDASAEPGQVLAADGSGQTEINLESFESVDELEAAAEAALNRANTFTNDPSAPVQFPFSSGVPLTDGFGPRAFPVYGFHDAQDFGAGYGGAVRSIADGTVIESGASSDGCGFGLKISHRIDGQDVASRYCHLATAPVVAIGDRVRVGQFVALVGSSGLSFGAHLHLVVEVNGKAVDPMEFIARYNKPRSEWG